MTRLRVIIAATLLMSLHGIAAAAGYDFEYQGLFFDRAADGSSECTLVRNVDAPYDGTVVVPAEALDGDRTISVTAIADTAFINSRVETLSLPATIRRIGANAFAGCSHLNSLEIADLASWCSVEMAGASSNPFAEQFYGSQSLRIAGEPTKAITIPEGVTAIAPYAFYKWECIRSLRLPQSVATIGREAFRECIYISEITFSDGLRKVETGAFLLPEWLRTVNIASLEHWCSIEFASPNANPLTGDRLERIVTPEGEITDLVIPDDVSHVGAYAFYSCPVIRSVVIPDGVQSMGPQTFWGCENLTSATIGDGLSELPEGTFMNCKNLSDVSFGQSLATIGESAFSNCNALTELNFPSSLRSVGQTAFAFLQQMPSLTLPEGTERIGQGAFSWCTELTDVELPSTLSKVEFAAFAFCNKLRGVKVERAQAPEAPSTNLPFSSTAYSTATLSVPQGARSSYNTAPGWDRFSNIEEYTPSGIDGIEADGICSGETKWQIHDTRGVCLGRGVGNPVMPQRPGVYILTRDGQSNKIVIR